jgi:hypothetical protein
VRNPLPRGLKGTKPIPSSSSAGITSVVDKIVDRPVDRLEGNLLRHAGGDDAPGLLPHRGLMPTRVPSVIAARVEGAIDCDGPDPCRRAIGRAVLAERRDVQIVGLGDPPQLLFLPCHCGFFRIVSSTHKFDRHAR